MYNKAQGLPMNTLVLGALALLVLIGMVSIFASGGGSIFGALGTVTSGATPSSSGQARITCDSACSNLQLGRSGYVWPSTTQGAVANSGVLASEKYCKLAFDLSKETGVDSDNARKCYDTQIGSSCSLSGLIIKAGNGC